MTRYQFNEDMQEISGFGGEYEACCRRMLAAGLEWFDAHPEADPKFRGYKNVYGVITKDNADAKALSEAVIAGAGKFGPSGAMHQAVVSAALWIKANGWDAYVARITHPEGQVGIVMVGRVRSLIGAAVLQSSWTTKLAWLAEPCLVIRVRPKSEHA